MTATAVPGPYDNNGLKPLDDEDKLLPGHRSMVVMDGTGDSKFQWDPENPAEVEAARVQFNKLKKEHRYQGFRVDKKGEPAEKMDEFDPTAGQVIMTRQTRGG